LNFKASAAETGIFHGLKIVFLESTVNKLSTNDLLVYQKTVHEDIQSRLFQVHKGRTIRKVMGGGGTEKKSMQTENV
jgi:hypothetical protein